MDDLKHPTKTLGQLAALKEVLLRHDKHFCAHAVSDAIDYIEAASKKFVELDKEADYGND